MDMRLHVQAIRIQVTAGFEPSTPTFASSQRMAAIGDSGLLPFRPKLGRVADRPVPPKAVELLVGR